MKEFLRAFFGKYKNSYSHTKLFEATLHVFAMFAFFMWLLPDIHSAIIATSSLAMCMFLNFITNKKFGIILTSIFIASIGCALIYSVLEDFIKSAKISIGFIFIQIAFKYLMDNTGNPDIRILQIIQKYTQKITEIYKK